MLGLIAVVLTGTALLSGVVERSPLSFPLIFLALGFALGERGMGVFEMGPHDPLLNVVATLTLSLVLFLDAVNMSFAEMGRRWLIPALILGPGTVLIIVLGAVPLALMLGFGWMLAFIGGAILASTDPVVLREVIRDRRIPRSVSQTLKIEAGTNDIVILPVVLVLIAVARENAAGFWGWGDFLIRLLLLGPAIGMVIGGFGSWLISQLDRRMGIRREHQALYGIGLVLAAYTAATAAGGDGFLSAFAAGMAVVLLNQRLCDCFLEYGETTSEAAMLLAFILFGAVLSGIIGNVLDPTGTCPRRDSHCRCAPRRAWPGACQNEDELGGSRPCELVRPQRTELFAAGAARGRGRHRGLRASFGDRGSRGTGVCHRTRSHRDALQRLVRPNSVEAYAGRGAGGHRRRTLLTRSQPRGAHRSGEARHSYCRPKSPCRARRQVSLQLRPGWRADSGQHPSIA